VPAGLARCYQCDLALREAGGLLADAVAVVGYAVRGGGLATDLWRYKSDRPDAAECGERLRVLLDGFLRDHAGAVWQAAGMPHGPTGAAVVPSGQGRPGPHPLVDMARSCLPLPLIPLTVNPRAVHVRGVTLDWLRVGASVAGRNIVVVDDSWVSGGSAQSAAVALKRAGARRVAIVVLGRHVNPADPRSAGFLARALDQLRGVADNAADDLAVG
jgi:hypothetical protein